MDLPSYTPEDSPIPEGEIVVERASTPQELGPKLHRTAADVVRFLMQQGEMVTATQSLTDDMIDTGGTIVAAAELLKKRGAKEVWAMATHGLLSGPAVDRLKNAPLERLVLTNSLPLPAEKHLPNVEILSVAPLIAEALGAVFDDTSVSDIFDGENLS